MNKPDEHYEEGKLEREAPDMMKQIAHATATGQQAALLRQGFGRQTEQQYVAMTCVFCLRVGFAQAKQGLYGVCEDCYLEMTQTTLHALDMACHAGIQHGLSLGKGREAQMFHVIQQQRDRLVAQTGLIADQVKTISGQAQALGKLLRGTKFLRVACGCLAVAAVVLGAALIF